MRFLTWHADLSMRPFCWAVGHPRVFDEADGRTRCGLCGKVVGRWRR